MKIKNSQITCIVEFDWEDEINIEYAIAPMIKVNHLLTFCRGTIINHKSYSSNGKRYCIDPISTDFSIPGLILEVNFNQTKEFIENGFKKFDHIDQIYTLRKLAREYAYTRKNHSFITVRAYVAAPASYPNKRPYHATVGRNRSW